MDLEERKETIYSILDTASNRYLLVDGRGLGLGAGFRLGVDKAWKCRRIPTYPQHLKRWRAIILDDRTCLRSEKPTHEGGLSFFPKESHMF